MRQAYLGRRTSRKESQDHYKFSKHSLFNGFLLNWRSLTQSERVTCLGIILIPVWWLWGWSYLMFFLATGIFLYEFLTHRKVRLTSPSLIVVALVAYGTFDLLVNFFYGLYNGSSLSARDFLGVLNTEFSAAAIIWYIQSKKIRVRPSAVAWSFTFVFLLMFFVWAYVFFFNQQSAFEPPRSLFGFLTGKPVQYVPGLGNTNYLIPYRPEDSSLPGFSRYFYFFHGPESLALVCSFTALLALDIRNKTWSIFLFLLSLFILLTSGTRSIWLTLPVVVAFRYLIMMGRFKGTWVIYALIACFSAVSLMLPPVTDLLLDQAVGTAEATSEFRADSTDVRQEIYSQTFEEVLHASNLELIFGHVVPGETVLPGYAPAMIGTHSFYLGSLLYTRGLIGTMLFAAYWIALIQWLRQTSKGRPLSDFLIFLVFSLAFCVMAFESVVMPLTLVALVTREPKPLKQS